MNNSDLLYFAFAVEIPSTGNKFIDETIYTIKAILEENINRDDISIQSDGSESEEILNNINSWNINYEE